MVIPLSCFLLALLWGVLCACTPNFIPPGPAVNTPHLADDALITADNTRLPMRVWQPESAPKAIVIALHGFNDYSNFISASAPLFVERHIAVYAYDQRGFGQSPNRGRWPGIPAFTSDLTTMISLARDKHPETPLYLLGESMGGAVILVTMAAKKPPPVDGVILLAPAVWSRRAMPFYQSALLWLTAHTVPWWQPTGASLKIIASDNLEMLYGLGRDPLIIKKTRIDTTYGLVDLMDEAYEKADIIKTDFLFLYGKKDELIPRKPTLDVIDRMIAASLTSSRFVLYENGYHMLLRDLQGKVVLEDVLAWLSAKDKPLPSIANGKGKELYRNSQKEGNESAAGSAS